MVILALGIGRMTLGAEKEVDFFPSFTDKHTVGLWLFDETDYPYATLTDASENEYDLRLMKGGKLVPGKFGNCLKLTPGLDYAVSYAAWKGAVGFNRMREASGRPGSGLFGPTIAPERIARTFAERDFTCEFWLLLMSNPIQDIVLIDLGDKFEPGFSVTLKKQAKGFTVENAYAGFKAVCPTVLDQIWGRAWHHIAFTYSADSNRLCYFIDGRTAEPVKISKVTKSKVPASVRPESIADTTYGIFEKEDRTSMPDYDKRIRHRFNFAIGHDRHGEKDFNGNLDELRFSDVIRYNADFSLPDSFSRNYRKDAPKPAATNGPPLLFGADKKYLPNEPVMLGSRKHVFIDEVIVDRKQNVKLTLNPPTRGVKLNIKAAWDASFFEHEGRIYTVKSEGYEGDEGPIQLFVSDDGVSFKQPMLGLIEHNGSKENNLIMLGLPSWGKYFKDTNPACLPAELFKEGITVLGPDIFNPNKGQIFRTRPQKYEWAPDTYVAFMFRSGCDMAVSRDAVNWKIRPELGFYMPPGRFMNQPDWQPESYGKARHKSRKTKQHEREKPGLNEQAKAVDSTDFTSGDIANGIIRRGDELWQYANCRMTGGGLATVRFTQRLDGFLSLDAGDEPGTFITRPFVFEGDELVLNVAAEGSVKVGITNLPGMEVTGFNIGLTNPPKIPVTGFGIGDCDPITTDSVRHVVTWKGDSDVGNLAGQVVRLRFEMQNAKLYAFKFD